MRRYGKLHRLGIGNLHYIRYLLLPHINDASAFHVPTCTDLLGVTTYTPYLPEHIDLATPVLYSLDNYHICGQRKVTSELTYRYLYIRQ